MSWSRTTGGVEARDEGGGELFGVTYDEVGISDLRDGSGGQSV